jgi:hypothetical protein
LRVIGKLNKGRNVMLTLKRSVAAFLASASLVGVSSLAAPTANASVYPSPYCTAKATWNTYMGWQEYAYCSGGTNILKYRIAITCPGWGGVYAYGPYVTLGHYSWNGCGAGAYPVNFYNQIVYR